MSALTDLLTEWMPHQRWFSGKGREWAGVTEDGFFLDESTPALSVHRVRVAYADGAFTLTIDGEDVVAGVRTTAAPDGEPVGGRSEDRPPAKPRGKRRARPVGHEPG